VLRGRVIFFLAKLVPGLLGLGTTAMLTRWVEPAEYGVYAFGLSIILFTVAAGYDWLCLSLLRFRPSFPEAEFLFGTLIVVFCVFCAGIAAFTGVGTLLSNSWSYAPFLAACLFSTFATAWFELKLRVQLAELMASAHSSKLSLRRISSYLMSRLTARSISCLRWWMLTSWFR